MEMNANHYLYTPVAQDCRPLHGQTQDLVFRNIPKLASNRLVQPDIGNSIVALLSGPPSVLQCDTHELLNPKMFATSSKLPTNDRNASGSRSSLGSPEQVMARLSNQNIQSGAESVLHVSSQRLVSTHSAGSHCNLQSVGSSVPLVSVGQLSGNLSAKNMQNVAELRSVASSQPAVEWHNTTTSRVGELRSTDVLMSKVNSFVSEQSSTSTSRCPRVFCLGKSGHLLLSNTGLLGVLCSCHCYNMSVSKFCQHSGLHDINPGDAVQMDSGETISQWRKHYFQRFGIRVPEDRSGWDWPEGISSGAGLAKASGTWPNMSVNSNLTHLGAPFGEFMMPGVSLDSKPLPNNHLLNQNLASTLHDNTQRNAHISNGFRFKGLTPSKRNAGDTVMDSLTVGCSISDSLLMSNVVGREPSFGHRLLPNPTDSVIKIGNSSTTQCSFQNAQNHEKTSDIARIKDARDIVTMDRNASSSNFELRLGQPLHQSKASGNLVLSVGTKQSDAPVEPLKSPFTVQTSVNVVKGREKEGARPHLSCAAAHSDAVAIRETGQLNLGNHMFGNMTTISATRLENCMGGMTNNSLDPKYFNGHLEGKLSLNVTNSLGSMNEHNMPGLPFISHSANCDPVRGPYNGRNSFEGQANISDSGLFQLLEKDKSCIGNITNVSMGLLHRVHTELAHPFSLPEVAGGKSDPNLSAVHGQISLSRQLPMVPLDAVGVRNLPDNPKKFPCFRSGGNTDLRPIDPSKDPAQDMASQTVSASYAASSSISMPGVMDAVSKQYSFSPSPYLLDENMRFLAMAQVLELSKQQHASSILGRKQKHERFVVTSTVDSQHSLVDLSISAERKQGHTPCCHLDDSEVAIKPFPCVFSERTFIGQLAPVTGLNTSKDLTKPVPRISCSRETDVQSCQCFHDSVLNDSSASRNDKIVSQSNGRENCCSRPSHVCYHCNHDCATNKQFLAVNCDSTCGSCPHSFNQWIGGINGEPSKLVASEYVEKDLLLKGETASSLQGRTIIGERPKDHVSHVPQWRDVPSKSKRDCDVSADVLSGKQRDDSQAQVKETTAECCSNALQVADSLKEQERSNISSGSSAPVVSHASVENNDIKCSIVDAENTGCANSSIVDEGSRIDKCWSSDDTLENDRSAELISSSCKTEDSGQGSSRFLTNQSCRTLLEEIKLLDSLTWKKGRNPGHNEIATQGKLNHPENFARDLKISKSKKAMPSKFLVKVSSRKRDLYALYNGGEAQNDFQTEIGGNARSCEVIEASCRKKYQQSCSPKALRRFQKPEIPDDGDNADADADAGALESMNYKSVGFTKASSSHFLSVFKPVVCGEYGEICCGKQDEASNLAKYLSLSVILKRTKRCTLKNSKHTLTSSSKSKKICHIESRPSCDKFLKLNKVQENGGHQTSFCDEIVVDLSVEETRNTCTDGEKQTDHRLSVLEKACSGKGVFSIINNETHTHLKPKFKEIRKRSLYELTVKGASSNSKSVSPVKESEGILQQKRRKYLHDDEDSEDHLLSSCEANAGKSNQKQKCFSNMDSDASCCVCGSSNQDNINHILECSQCLIKVHQACYGVSRVPKGSWYCRPCKANSKDTVCVLCGYGGGAMTRALGSHTIAKSLMKAWHIESEDQPKNIISPCEIKPNLFNSSGCVRDGNSLSVLAHVSLEPLNVGGSNMDEQNHMVQNSSAITQNLKVPNSITAGMLDQTVKQWIHMVCGLWTSETRCPNVDTMSAFDVSGVSLPGENVVCSLCNRPGGSSIQCRVVSCSIRFHPWCAHKKGLLQSELEGIDNENVGFYGTCALHATFSMCESNNGHFDLREEPTCARTEGYKGRKRDGFWHNLYGQSKGKNGCLVPQEQLNAWNHINGQKSTTQPLSTQGLPKLPMPDVEYDCRKEYARYKQTKGWKRLVVYKSGIHALGLYTSQFISRGEMVVEYVGEIIGQRVSDKRENEYGRKLQYKSACYFFKIDKEHIVDATCKGGIARFVNHSCFPNCIAKVISVRNEKKVVFFAQRDIYPGEEITYDYHFNHEDEGKKIPCFCNSKNCRRYMN